MNTFCVVDDVRCPPSGLALSTYKHTTFTKLWNYAAELHISYALAILDAFL